jgi:hypothetical protein
MGETMSRQFGWMRLAPVILAVVASSRVVARDLDATYDPRSDPEQGAIAISLTYPKHAQSFSLWYTRAGKIWPKMVSASRFFSTIDKAQSDFADASGQLKLVKIEPGEYEFSSFEYSDGRSIRRSDCCESRLRFEVRPGKVTYLGRANVKTFDLPAGSSQPMPYTVAWPQFSDESEADFAVLSAQYPRVTRDVVDSAADAASGWSRAWGRDVLCTSWGSGIYDDLRKFWSSEGYPWERSFAEFALAVQTCGVGTADARHVPAIAALSNLEGAEVSFEGAVRSISVGRGNIALDLDVEVPDSPVKVWWSYSKPAAEAPITCCIVYGRYDSWRDVKAGDRIRVQGRLDAPRPLLFGVTQESAGTTPIRPVLINARATVLESAP